MPYTINNSEVLTQSVKIPTCFNVTTAFIREFALWNLLIVLHLLLVVAIVTTIAGILIFWKNFIYDYSLTSTVFDNTSDVAHLLSTNFA